MSRNKSQLALLHEKKLVVLPKVKQKYILGPYVTKHLRQRVKARIIGSFLPVGNAYNTSRAKKEKNQKMGAGWAFLIERVSYNALS